MRIKIIMALIAVLLINMHLKAEPQEKFDPSGEAIELGIYTSLYAGGWFLGSLDPFFDRPLIGGGTNRSYVENETVPSYMLAWWTAGTFGLVILLPNDKGMMNMTTYRNAKGLFETMAYTTFITQFTKTFFGRKRPSYDNYPSSTKETDGRKSFISGHSSTAFALATYGSLFISCQTCSGNKAADYTYKTLTSTALISAAVYTGWSRVHDHRHHASDVIAGAVTGTAAALTGYIHQNGMRGIFPETGVISFFPVVTYDWYGAGFSVNM